MTQPNSQQVQTVAAQPARMGTGSTGTFTASVRGMGTVALSLLVDRALSA